MKKNISINRTGKIKIIPLIILLLVAISIFVSIYYYDHRKLQQSNYWLVHSHQILYKSEKVLSTLKDIETGTRGFVLTGDTAFLQPYYYSKDTIDSNINALKTLTKENALQQESINKLAVIAAMREKMYQTAIKLKHNKNFESSEVIQLLQEDKKIMDKIRFIINTIQAEENRLLAIKQHENTRKIKTSEKSLYIFFLSVVVLFAAAFFTYWYFEKIVKTQSGSLAQLNSRITIFSKRIDDVIKGISDPFFSLDKNFNFIFLNDAMQNTIGLGKGSLIGKNIFEVFPGYKENMLGKNIQKAIQHGKSMSFEIFDEFVNQWQDITVYQIFEGIAIYIKDATKRKAYEKELQTTREFLEETNKVAIVGGWEVDMFANTVIWTEVTAIIHETAPDYKPDLKSGIAFYKEGKSRETIIQLVNDAIKNGKEWDAELQIVTAKGNEKWIRTKGKALFENSECVRIFGIFQDITAKKLSEKKFEDEKKLLQDIIDNLPMNLYVKDLDSRKILVNKSELKYSGASSKEEILGKNDFDLYPFETAKISVEEDKQVSTTKKAILNKETKSIKNDGSETSFLTSKIPLLNEQNEIIGILGISYITNELNRIFIQQSPNAIAMFDKDMRYMAASKRWMEDYQLYGKELVGRSHYEIFPEIGDDWKSIHQQGLQGKINTCAEASFERADGSLQWITWDVRPWYISEGNIGGLLMYTADITDAKTKEQERWRIEEILDKTNEVARIGTWEVDLIKNTVAWSRITKEIHEVNKEYEPELNTTFNFFKEGASRENIIHAVSAAIKNGTPYDLELELITATGNTVWTRAIGQAEFKNGTCIRLYGIFQNIDETKKSREALNKLNDELKAILNSECVSIIGTNMKGVITHFNRGAEALLQYSASEMIGSQTPEIIHDKDELIQKGTELTEMYGRPIHGFDILVELATQGNYGSGEWMYTRKDGSVFPVHLAVTAIRNEQGEPIGFLEVATDISDIKKVKNTLFESNLALKSINHQLNQKNAELEQFAFVAAHDLQEPLRIIASFLSLLNQKYSQQLDDKGKQYIEYSVNGALRMRDIIKDILDFSKSSTISNISLDLNTLVNGIVLGYNNDEKYKFANIHVATLPVINADPTAMEQLFTNLIGNGLKYQPAGNVPVISITAEDINDKWLFRISDNGIGIDPKHYDKVFAIFKRLHSKSEYSGTGIGLATCKKIVSLYNGDIWIEANNGNGSIFCFTIIK